MNTEYTKILNPYTRSEAIVADGRGNWGKDVPAGLTYYSGLYLTGEELAKARKDEARDDHAKGWENMAMSGDC